MFLDVVENFSLDCVGVLPTPSLLLFCFFCSSGWGAGAASVVERDTQRGVRKIRGTVLHEERTRRGGRCCTQRKTWGAERDGRVLAPSGGGRGNRD